MLDLAPAGFEETDGDGFVELAVYTDAAGEARMRERFANAVTAVVSGGWEDRWRAFHAPTQAGGLWIGPPWEAAPAAQAAVVVDPGRAFGTGAHPTTRACIELLVGLPSGSMLDAGCGSGVVAVAAAKLGFEPVWAIDVDPVAVEVARETARRNRSPVSVRQADVLSDDLPEVDVAVANIALRAVEAFLRRRPAAVVVASGYVADERPRVPGWESRARIELDGWAADVFVAA